MPGEGKPRTKATRKKATRKKATRKKAARGKATRNAAKKSLASHSAANNPPGHERIAGGLLVRPEDLAVVAPNAFKKGFESALNEITEIATDVLNTMARDFSISEIELSASFDASGKFLGFGVGGAASIKIKIKPKPVGMGL